MSTRDRVAAAGILTAITLGVPLTLQPLFAVADQTVKTSPMEDEPGWDCRVDGNKICGPNNMQGVTPGWYGDDDCWPGAIYCPDIDGPYDPGKVHPGMSKPHTFIDGRDVGPTIMVGMR